MPFNLPSFGGAWQGFFSKSQFLVFPNQYFVNKLIYITNFYFIFQKFAQIYQKIYFQFKQEKAIYVVPSFKSQYKIRER